MNRTREKLPNANKWCHIYTDIDGVTNIHNTETNETYRIIPETSALGFQLERHKDGELRVRNTISFDELRILSDLAGSNHLLEKLADKGGEVAETFNQREMKQTAVEWLIEKVNEQSTGLGMYGINVRIDIPADIIQQAKEMEKERMFEVYHEYQDYLDNEFKNQCGGESVILTFEEHYNKNF